MEAKILAATSGSLVKPRVRQRKRMDVLARRSEVFFMDEASVRCLGPVDTSNSLLMPWIKQMRQERGNASGHVAANRVDYLQRAHDAVLRPLVVRLRTEIV